MRRSRAAIDAMRVRWSARAHRQRAPARAAAHRPAQRGRPLQRRVRRGGRSSRGCAGRPGRRSRSSQPARPGRRVDERGARQHQLRASRRRARRRAHARVAVAPREQRSSRVDAVAPGSPAARRGGRARVDAEVLPEVDELQRGADRIRSAQRAARRRCRTDAAAGGRPGWPSGGSSRAARRGRRSASCATSCANASSRSSSSGERQARCARSPARSGPNTSGQRGEGWPPAATAIRSARIGRKVGEALLRRAHRLRRRCRRRCARSGRWRSTAGAARRAQQRGDREVLVVIDAHRRDCLRCIEGRPPRP